MNNFVILSIESVLVNIVTINGFRLSSTDVTTNTKWYIGIDGSGNFTFAVPYGSVLGFLGNTEATFRVDGNILYYSYADGRVMENLKLPLIGRLNQISTS